MDYFQKMGKILDVINGKSISLPGIITCIKCLGWGTVLKGKNIESSNNQTRGITFKTITCDKCDGTGRRPIPPSEID